jgi:hypothetical protein
LATVRSYGLAAMLNNPSEQIKECYWHAEECERLAREETGPTVRQDFLDAATRWMRLARSYKFTEQLERFTYKPKKADERKK